MTWLDDQWLWSFSCFPGAQETKRGPFTLTQRLFKILISAPNWTICVRSVISFYRRRSHMMPLMKRRSALLKVVLNNNNNTEDFFFFTYRYEENYEIMILLLYFIWTFVRRINTWQINNSPNHYKLTHQWVTDNSNEQH